jgi:Ran GTPase-activating protein (RanGAP) involved in mRNA processing and transport
VAVTDVIRDNRNTLVHLDLSENPIGPFGVAMVAEALHDNTCLEVLRLRRSGIRDRGMMVLGEILQECSALRVLDLSDSNLGPASVPGLVEAIEMSVKLEELYLGWNPLQQGAEQILRWLLLMRCIMRRSCGFWTSPTMKLGRRRRWSLRARANARGHFTS